MKPLIWCGFVVGGLVVCFVTAAVPTLFWPWTWAEWALMFGGFVVAGLALAPVLLVAD